MEKGTTVPPASEESRGINELADGITDERLAPQHLKRTVLQGGIAKLGSQAANVLVRIGALMFFARLLEPTDFGLVGMVAAVTGVLGLLKDFGLSTATIQRASISTAQISTLFWFNLLLGVILWLLCVAIAPLLVWFYREPRLLWITIALGGGFFLTAASVQHNALLQRKMRFVTLAVIDVVALLLSTATGLTMAIMGLGYWSLVGWSVALPAATCVGVWLAAAWLPGLPRRGVGARSMLRFGGLVTLNIMVAHISFNLDKVLLGRYWGAEILGLYGRGYQLTSMATDNLLSAIGAVAFPALSRAQGEPARLESYFLKGYKLVLTIALPVALACVLFAEDIVFVLLGAGWEAVVPVLRLLAPLIAIFALIHPLGWLLYSLGMVGRSLRVALAITPLVTLGYVAGLSFGATGVAAGYTLALALWVVPHVLWCTKGTPVSPWSLFRQARTPGLAGVAASAAAYGAHVVLADFVPLARLFLEGAVLCIVYAWVVLWVLNERDFYFGLIRSLREGDPIGTPSPRA